MSVIWLKPLYDKWFGPWLAGAIKALQAKGACLESEWPFDLENVNTAPPTELYDQAMDYKISNSISVPVDLETMKQCVADVRTCSLMSRRSRNSGEHSKPFHHWTIFTAIFQLAGLLEPRVTKLVTPTHSAFSQVLRHVS